MRLASNIIETAKDIGVYCFIMFILPCAAIVLYGVYGLTLRRFKKIRDLAGEFAIVFSACTVLLAVSKFYKVYDRGDIK